MRLSSLLYCRKLLGTLFIVMLLVSATMVAMIKVTSASPDTYFYVDPPEVRDIAPGGYFTITVNVTDAPPSYSWEVYLEWDNTLLNVSSIKEGDFLHRWKPNPFPPPDFEPKYDTTLAKTPLGEANVDGEILVYCTLMTDLPMNDWASGDGWLFTLEFLVLDEGGTSLNLFDTRLWDHLTGDPPYPASTYYPNEDGFFSNFHDIAITNVTCSPTIVTIGEIVSINVTVTNDGNFTENFNVTTYYDNTPIEEQTNINLDAGATTTLTLEWNTTFVSAGIYNMSAEASEVPNETNTTNNLFTDGNVTVQRLTGWPVANFTYSPEKPLLINGEAKVTFNSTSYDEDGYIVSWSWDFNADSFIDATTENATWIYTQAKDYVVRLIVNDNDTFTPPQGKEKIITVYALPIANFTYSPEDPMSGETVTFNATDSYDDGYIVSYKWDFGDGVTEIYVKDVNLTAIATHIYADDGVYTVTLNLTDNDGLSNITSANITVLNRPPVALFTESAETVLTGVTIEFDASSSEDPDGSILSYFWDFGDETNANGMIVTHAYADDGVYTVTLTVTDEDEATATTTSTKTVLNRPPVANFTESAETVDTGETITFNASDSYDPDGSIVSYFWDFGDGTNATGVTVEHAYTDDGTYTVTLTVTDDDGASSSVSATKTVNAPEGWSLVWYAVIGLGIAALTLIALYALYRRRKE